MADQGSSGLLLGIVLVISLGGLATAFVLAKWVLGKSTGSEAMQKISNAIKEGAEAFLRTQNRTIIMLAGGLAVILFLGYGVLRSHKEFDPVGSSTALAGWITFSFILGAICSILAGYVGMWVSIRSNIRTATAALSSLNDALQIALRGGAVSVFNILDHPQLNHHPTLISGILEPRCRELLQEFFRNRRTPDASTGGPGATSLP